LGAEKNTAIDGGSDHTIGSDPLVRGIFSFSIPQWPRLAIVHHVANVVFTAKDVVYDSSSPRSSEMIGDAFAIEPPSNFLLGCFVLNVLLEYSLDHLHLVWVTETQDDTIRLQVLLLAAREISFGRSIFVN
jgi:hypothetical protein